MHPGGNVWRFPERKVFVLTASSHFANDNQARMNPDADAEWNGSALASTAVAASTAANARVNVDVMAISHGTAVGGR